MFDGAYRGKMDINESSKMMIDKTYTTNTANIVMLNKCNFKAILIELQYKSQEEIYEKVLEIRITIGT